uniref:Uncharacterized protein n=1 Tax=Chromera velia CCMP2878 TaxID=1169474 RepID=A0A0G4H9T8_9ALVE|eukprot:Cvel_5975.t1-p1 / transcript=Cvel_5975.t1 / gene=Cvel_5975 / organism=Chromera_velia_CCMP2878 / gene_product=hypothetical protein / transcript_product=hypothetical protein / location=Cvel_scaffold286:36968-43968(-) / protein_length=229 / sequence_SO=supercontig / SO=protein_coding / is_pseudo=false
MVLQRLNPSPVCSHYRSGQVQTLGRSSVYEQQQQQQQGSSSSASAPASRSGNEASTASGGRLGHEFDLGGFDRRIYLFCLPILPFPKLRYGNMGKVPIEQRKSVLERLKSLLTPWNAFHQDERKDPLLNPLSFLARFSLFHADAYGKRQERKKELKAEAERLWAVYFEHFWVLAQRHEVITKRNGGTERRKEEYKAILEAMEAGRQLREGKALGRKSVNLMHMQACTQT